MIGDPKNIELETLEAERDAARAEEREACAQLVESYRAGMRLNDGKDASKPALRAIAAAIRARRSYGDPS